MIQLAVATPAWLAMQTDRVFAAWATNEPHTRNPKSFEQVTGPTQAHHVPPGWYGDQGDGELGVGRSSRTATEAKAFVKLFGSSRDFQRVWDDSGKFGLRDDLPHFGNDRTPVKAWWSFIPDAIGNELNSGEVAIPADHDDGGGRGDGHSHGFSHDQPIDDPIVTTLSSELAGGLTARASLGRVDGIGSVATYFLTRPGQETRDPASHNRRDSLNSLGGAHAQGVGSPRPPLLDQLGRPV